MSPLNSTRTIGNWTAITQWAQAQIGSEMGKVKVRVRGNILHILCESTPHCPPQDVVESRLIEGLVTASLDSLLPADQPPIYQIWLYGRVSGPNYPDWTQEIDVQQLLKNHLPGSSEAAAVVERHGSESLEEQTVTPSRCDGAGGSHTETPPSFSVAVADRMETVTSSRGGIVVSNRNLAAEGNPHAIARYLSETLSPLGIGVKVKIKTLKKTTERDLPVKRLHVGCYSNYSPDPSLLGPNIARQLRELELIGFRDAAIACQVHGENSPDWVLLVDLTPRSVMLNQWARWGDVPAINRLLDQRLAHECLNISAILKESTLHLFCRGTSVPHQKNVVARIQNLLNIVAPQGIHAATIYGHLNHQSSPVWVDWIDLPGRSPGDRHLSTLELAKQGHQTALQFLLNRLLNPEIDQQLSTGGIRIQLLLKEDLLHVMTDAPGCPNQRQVGPLVAKFLRQLKIPRIAGLRVYGRRCGQKLPRWHYGVDFKPRKRLVPEAPPEFAASSAYVGDLIALDRSPQSLHESTATSGSISSTAGKSPLTPPASQELSTAPQPSSKSPRPRKRSLLDQCQQVLIHTGLLAPKGGLEQETRLVNGHSSTSLVHQSAPVSPPPRQWQTSPQVWIALVWGTLGLLLTLEIDWLLGYHLTKSSGGDYGAVYPPMPINLGGNPANASDESLLGKSGSSGECPTGECLLSTPSPYPSFNNQLVNEHLGRYHAQMLESGPADILIIGSSRALRGIDPQRLREELAALGYGEVKIYNFGINGATAKVVDWAIRDLLVQEQLPKLIIWADGARAFNSGREDLTYEAIATSVGYQELRAQTLVRPLYGQPWSAQSHHQQEEPKLPAFSITTSYERANDWLEKGLGTLSAVYPQRDRLHTQIQDTLSTVLPQDPSQRNTAEDPEMLQPAVLNPDGFLPFTVRFDPDTYYQHHPQVSGAYDRDYEFFSLAGEQDEALKNLIAYTQSMGVNLLFVNMPLTQVYLDPIRTSYEQEFQTYIQSYQQPGFQVKDWIGLWSGGEHGYFSDPSHLNRYGAEVIATTLAHDPDINWAEKLNP